MRDEILRGKVALILDSRHLVINIGADIGVKEGMIFSVMSPGGAEVRDPDTNEVLDVLPKVKARVRAVEVRPRIAICRSYSLGERSAALDYITAALGRSNEPAPVFTPRGQTGQEQRVYVGIGDPVVLSGPPESQKAGN